MEINKAVALVHENAQNKGFWESYDNTNDDQLRAELISSKLMLAVTELAEATEALRIGDDDNFAEELIDTVIRVFDVIGKLRIDANKVMMEKMSANSLRPVKHGKKF